MRSSKYEKWMKACGCSSILSERLHNLDLKSKCIWSDEEAGRMKLKWHRKERHRRKYFRCCCCCSSNVQFNKASANDIKLVNVPQITSHKMSQIKNADLLQSFKVRLMFELGNWMKSWCNYDGFNSLIGTRDFALHHRSVSKAFRFIAMTQRKRNEKKNQLITLSSVNWSLSDDPTVCPS